MIEAVFTSRQYDLYPFFSQIFRALVPEANYFTAVHTLRNVEGEPNVEMTATIDGQDVIKILSKDWIVQQYQG